MAELRSDFAAEGLGAIGVRSFAQPVQLSLRAWRDALALRPQSAFTALSEADFQSGLQRLSAAADTEATPVWVYERYDVLTFAA